MQLAAASFNNFSFDLEESESVEESNDLRYEEIASQIRNLFVGTRNDHCVGAVFTWITHKSTDLDKKNTDIQGMFKRFQGDYSNNRGDPEIDFTYLPLPTLEKFRMEEFQTSYFPIKDKSNQEISQLIFKQAVEIGKKLDTAMVLLYHQNQPHAFGLKTTPGNYRLFDIALSKDFRAENEEDLTLGIEALVAIYSDNLQKKVNDVYSHFQLISFQDY